jgi:hypothetical protein
MTNISIGFDAIVQKCQTIGDLKELVKEWSKQDEKI